MKSQVLTNLTYDANGNLTGDGTWTYTYDVENRLINATDGSTDVDYVYDPLGRRVKKDVIGGAETFYLSDGTEEILELDDRGDTQNRYVFGPGVDEPVLMYTGDRVSNNKKRYYRADPQGSIIALTERDGTVEDTYTYDAYGNPDQAGGNAIRYTGRRWDAETGLYYYRARMYNPALGRFLQTDPIGYGDNTNLYGYVGNDPVNANDPSGKLAFLIPLIACAANAGCRAAVGAAVGAVAGAAVNVAAQFANGAESISDIDRSQVFNAGAGGAIIGAVVATTGNTSVIAGTGALVTGAQSHLTDVETGAFDEDPVGSLMRSATSAAVGAVTTTGGAQLGAATKTIVDDVVLAVAAEVATVAGIQKLTTDGGAEAPATTTPKLKKETCAMGPC